MILTSIVRFRSIPPASPAQSATMPLTPRGWVAGTLDSILKKDAVDLPHETLWPMKTVTPMNA